MRIAYLVHQYPPEQVAGTELFTHRMASFMRGRGHEVHVLTASHAHDKSYFGHEDGMVEDVPVRRLFHHPHLAPNPFLYEFYNPALRPYVAGALAEWRPDVVHVTHAGYLSSSALFAAAAHGRPIVYSLTDYWLLCPTIQLVRHDETLCRGPEPGVCQICMSKDRYAAYFGDMPVRVPAEDYPPELFPPGPRSLMELCMDSPAAHHAAVDLRPGFLRRAFEHVTVAVSPSHFLRDVLVDNGYPRSRIRVVPHGIDAVEVRADRISMRLQGTGYRYGYIGSLAPRKGVHALIAAMKLIPEERGRRESTLDIFGSPHTDPIYAEELRRLAGDDPRIRFRGGFPRAAAKSVYAQIDALVVPSQWYENAPMVLREAMLNRLPIVAFDLGGMREALAGGGGLLVPLGDVTALADAMQRLKDEPGLAESLVESAPSVPTRADELGAFERLYQELVPAS